MYGQGPVAACFPALYRRNMEHTAETVRALAARNGLDLDPASVAFNPSGLDFLGATARDRSGRAWMIRLPRRPDARTRAGREGRILKLLAPLLPVAVPDWKIASAEIIAYPLLAGTPAATVDPEIGSYRWHIDPANPTETFIRTSAQALAALHSVPVEALRDAGVEPRDADAVRRGTAGQVDTVTREFAVAPALLRAWRRWLDDDPLWPDFAAVVHGDMHPGHMLVEGADHRLTGLIDWTEVEAGDPAGDLVAFRVAFGDDALARFLDAYEAAGGRTWPGMARQVEARWLLRGAQYALFALESGDPAHREAAQGSLDATAAELG